MDQKPVRDLFLIFVKNPNNHSTQEIILKIRHFEKGLSKNHKKVNSIFFFSTQSFLMDKGMKNKRGLELVNSHFFRLQKIFRKIPSLVIYCLTKFDDVI